MEENKKNDLDMSVFGDAPVIDVSEDEALFFEDDVDIEGNPVQTDTEQDEEIETQSNEDDLKDDPDTVVGEQDNDDAGDSDNPSDKDDGSSADPSPNLYSSLATLLNEEGLLSSVDSIEDKEKFIDAFRKEIEKNEFSDLSDVQKTYLKALRDGVPEEDVKENIKTMQGLDSIDVESLESDEQPAQQLRQRIIYNDFINRGFTEEKALKYLKRSIELQADKEDAKEALESLKQFNQKSLEQKTQEIAQQRQREEAEREAQVNKIKDTIKRSKEIINGFPLTDNVREQMEKNMFNIVSKSPDGKEENALMKYARENSDDFQLKMNYLFTITKGFEDFSIIEKTKNTKVVRDLEQALRSTTRIKDSGDPIYMQDPESQLIDIAGHDIVID